MKTFKNFHKGLISDDLAEYEDILIEEGILRSISGIGIMNKIRTISKKIESIEFFQKDDEVGREEKLMVTESSFFKTKLLYWSFNYINGDIEKMNNGRVSYNIRMTKEFGSVLKEICSIERIQNKSLLVRSMCHDCHKTQLWVPVGV
jgi:hypothetical protein